jgi:uncharacterized protein
MKIVFAVNHPAHYHLFKNPYYGLREQGHEVVFVVKDKDILGELMISEEVNFFKLTKRRVGKNRFSILAKGLVDLVIQNINLFKYVREFKPDLLVGTDYSITHIGSLLGIPSIVLNEDDYSINKYFCRLAYPLSHYIVSPEICDVGKYAYKKISYPGYQKLSYLHPDVFIPDPEIVKLYIPSPGRYFIIRMVSFSAGHDIEMKHGGIEETTLIKLLDILKPYGNVYITSESRIPESFAKHKLNIDIRHIHHLLAYATIFIADSQSMIVEAAMLGTPSIRYNSFVGKISVLQELEQKFGLTVGIRNHQPELLLQTVKEMLGNDHLEEEHQKRRSEMLEEKINVNSFLIWLFGNFPLSIKMIREDPDYQYNFIRKHDLKTIS